MTQTDFNLHDRVGDMIEAAGEHFVAREPVGAARLLRNAAEILDPATASTTTEVSGPSNITPGPWHCGADGRIVYCADGWAIANAITFHGNHRQGEAHANARLIAAAPELLRLMERLVHITPLRTLDRSAPLYNQMVEAVANATGAA